MGPYREENKFWGYESDGTSDSSFSSDNTAILQPFSPGFFDKTAQSGLLANLSPADCCVTFS